MSLMAITCTVQSYGTRTTSANLTKEKREKKKKTGGEKQETRKQNQKKLQCHAIFPSSCSFWSSETTQYTVNPFERDRGISDYMGFTIYSRHVWVRFLKACQWFSWPYSSGSWFGVCWMHAREKKKQNKKNFLDKCTVRYKQRYGKYSTALI